MLGEHYILGQSELLPKWIKGNLQLLILLGLEWGRVCGVPELCGTHPVAVCLPSAGLGVCWGSLRIELGYGTAQQVITILVTKLIG